MSDELWELIEPLIAVKPRRFRHPGRKPLPDRQVLTGILWEHLSQALGCGAGMTRGGCAIACGCRRRCTSYCSRG